MTGVGPLHEQNGLARKINYERNTVGRPTTNNGVGVDSTSTTHVIVERQQLRPNRKQQTIINEPQIQHHQLPSDGSGGHMKYYRIIFKGMVLISPDLDYDRWRHAQQPDLQKLGIHSDGHATVSKSTPDDDADNFKTNVITASACSSY
jgi:hypothetical protein